MRKKILKVFIPLLTFFGCQTAQERFLKEHKVLFAKTKEFEEFISKAKIKPSEARKLMTNYIHQNNLVGLGGEMYFIIDGNYSYTVDIQPKLPAANTSGIWVNAENGSVNYIKTGVFLRSFSKYEGTTP